MLNSYKDITGRYLKHNKKRTVLTIVGIILSVALISAIGLFLRAMQLGEIEKLKADYGGWHMVYKNPSEELIDKIKNNIKVERYGGYKIEEKGKINNKFYLVEYSFTDKAIELCNYQIKQGYFPQKEGEVAIEEWALSKINDKAKIGDTVTINDKKFIVSGILKNKVLNQQADAISVLTKVNKMDGDNQLLVEINDRANKKDAVKELGQLGDKYNAKHEINPYVLSMYGIGEAQAITGLLKLAAIVIGIVIASSIIVIYNSFNISVVERIKQFGLLRAIGMTPKQIRGMVLREASLLGIVGVPIGLLCGVIATYGIKFVFGLIGADSVTPLKIEIAPMILGISAAVGFASIYISSLLPSIFAGKISPLIAISSRATISKEKIKKKKGTVAKKLLGFEGMMAVKNMKRNKKRYRSTVLSIVISVILFVTFKYFMNLTLTVNGSDNEGTKVDLRIQHDNSEKEETDDFAINEDIIDSISKLQGVKKVYSRYSSKKFNTAIDKSKEVGAVGDFKISKGVNVNGKENLLMKLQLQSYDDELLESSKKYVSSGSIDIDKFKDDNSVVLIENVFLYDKDSKKEYRGKVADLKVGDEIVLKNDEDFNNGDVRKVKIAAIVKDAPFNLNGSVKGINIIGSKKLYENLTGIKELKPNAIEIILDKSKNTEAVVNEIDKIKDNQVNLKLYNYSDTNKIQKTAVLMVQILVYGFIVVVALIGAVNIINTITTNIILRKREFASLKAIGLTQGSLKKTIMLEGICYGVMGTLYGSIISTGLSYMIYRSISDNIRKTAWEIPWSAMCIAGAAALIIGYLATLSPLARVNKQNLIETIREDV